MFGHIAGPSYCWDILEELAALFNSSPVVPDSSGSCTPEPQPLRIDGSHPVLESPSLCHPHERHAPAFELKFLLPEAVAQEVESWARGNLAFDTNADPDAGHSYLTTTLYLDTPNWDVLQRSTGFRRRKFRLRRYGAEQTIFAECKTRHGDQVRKRRDEVAPGELTRYLETVGDEANDAAWFPHQVASNLLRPACRISYRRTAFMSQGASGALRLTLDRQVRGELESEWRTDTVVGAGDVLPGEVICEFKFRESLPVLFKEVIADLKLELSSCSKYRRVMRSLGKLELRSDVDA